MQSRHARQNKVRYQFQEDHSLTVDESGIDLLGIKVEHSAQRDTGNEPELELPFLGGDGTSFNFFCGRVEKVTDRNQPPRDVSVPLCYLFW